MPRTSPTPSKKEAENGSARYGTICRADFAEERHPHVPPAQRMPQVHQAQKLSSQDRESLEKTKKLLEERAAIRRLEEKQDALLAQNIAKIEVLHAFIFVCIDT